MAATKLNTTGDRRSWRSSSLQGSAGVGAYEMVCSMIRGRFQWRESALARKSGVARFSRATWPQIRRAPDRGMQEVFGTRRQLAATAFRGPRYPHGALAPSMVCGASRWRSNLRREIIGERRFLVSAASDLHSGLRGENVAAAFFDHRVLSLVAPRARRAARGALR